MMNDNDVKTVLTIAGSDCSGGAGIQADLKTMMAHGVYGMSVITSITVQNTLGVESVLDIDEDIVARQLDAVCSDIRPDAVKIGMVSSERIIEVIADKIRKYELSNIVLDPVMVSSSGKLLLSDYAVDCMVRKLMPLTDLVTPNIPEAEKLSGIKIIDDQSRIVAAQRILSGSRMSILIKGGHQVDCSDDMLYQNKVNEEIIWYRKQRVKTSNSHGTGCTLSSSIACNLAINYEMQSAVQRAKEYLYGALASGLNLGHGNGPVNHGWNIQSDMEHIADQSLSET